MSRRPTTSQRSRRAHPMASATRAHGRPSAGERTAASDVQDAAAAARAFLETYLRYRQGRLAASGIASASAPLQARLAAHGTGRDRVARRRHPRIAELHTQIQPGSGAASVAARVLDGSDAILSVSLRVERVGAEWEVSAVEHD